MFQLVSIETKARGAKGAFQKIMSKNIIYHYSGEKLNTLVNG